MTLEPRNSLAYKFPAWWGTFWNIIWRQILEIFNKGKDKAYIGSQTKIKNYFKIQGIECIVNSFIIGEQLPETGEDMEF